LAAVVVSRSSRTGEELSFPNSPSTTAYILRGSDDAASSSD
jgi:hypothetical protein